jgi:hypothetical protein
MLTAQAATEPQKIHCPFKLSNCGNKCRAYDNGKCIVLEYLEGIYFKVVLQ